MPEHYNEYVANLHVHTTYSDGSGCMDEVIAATRKAGLDVLLINDHDTLAARENGYEGYHGRLLVLVGLELSGPKNHYLVYGVDSQPEYDWQKPQEFIDRVKTAGGIGFLAHPCERGTPMMDNGQAYTWTDWQVTGFDGLCIWNYSSSFKAKVNGYPTAILHYYLRNHTLPGPDQAALDKWDELGQSQRVAGIGGSDAHAFHTRLGPFNFCYFPYKSLFRAINTHLLLPHPLTGSLDKDKSLIYSALAEGSCFVSHDRLHPGRGFDFWLENNGQRRAGQGQEAILEPGDFLTWRLPARALIRLIKDGVIILRERSKGGRVKVTEPGVYRLEAYRPSLFFNPRPWIFSNQVYVRARSFE